MYINIIVYCSLRSGGPKSPSRHWPEERPHTWTGKSTNNSGGNARSGRKLTVSRHRRDGREPGNWGYAGIATPRPYRARSGAKRVPKSTGSATRGETPPRNEHRQLVRRGGDGLGSAQVRFLPAQEGPQGAVGAVQPVGRQARNAPAARLALGLVLDS